MLLAGAVNSIAGPVTEIENDTEVELTVPNESFAKKYNIWGATVVLKVVFVAQSIVIFIPSSRLYQQVSIPIISS